MRVQTRQVVVRVQEAMAEFKSEAAEEGLEGSRELCPDLGRRRVLGFPILVEAAEAGREKASISSMDSWVGAEILIFTVLSSRESPDTDALSLPAPPRKRVARLGSGPASGDLSTTKGTQGVWHSQQPMDWSRSHAQWRHLVHHMHFAAGAVYMR